MTRIETIRAIERAAAFYRRHGLNPLASCGRLGHPPYFYVEDRDLGQTEATFSRKLSQVSVPAIQLACGVHSGLLVIDIDGEMAREVWADWCRFRNRPKTWMVDSPSGGRHEYYRIPQGVEVCPKRIAWRVQSGVEPNGQPQYAKHELIEVLGDTALAMAPPTRRQKAGKPVGTYTWALGCSPRDLREIALAPEWILGLPNVGRVEPRQLGNIAEIKKAKPFQSSVMFGYHDVFNAISESERIALVKSWGLCLCGRENQSGWIKCRAVDRDDRTPSAGFNPKMGIYAEPGRLKLRLFELAAYKGVYRTPSEACNAMGTMYLRHA